jgi:hypothetical protein
MICAKHFDTIAIRVWVWLAFRFAVNMQGEKCYWGHDPKNRNNQWGENLAMISTKQTVDAAWLESRIENGWFVSCLSFFPPLRRLIPLHRFHFCT